MNFNRRHGEEPEINLIPLIDVLLVVIIFLILTTTYTRFAGLEITLPTADVEENAAESRTNQVNVGIDANGQVIVNDQKLSQADPAFIAEALTHAAGDRKDPMIVIDAHHSATHQRVIDVMQAAQSSGYPRILFTVQAKPQDE